MYILDTEDAADLWMETEFDSAVMIDGDLNMWIAFASEDGDWHATRPAHEDDDKSYIGKGVTVPFVHLPLPILAWTYNDLVSQVPRG